MLTHAVLYPVKYAKSLFGICIVHSNEQYTEISDWYARHWSSNQFVVCSSRRVAAANYCNLAKCVISNRYLYLSLERLIEMEQKPVLLRLRETDTANGVTRSTLKLLAKTLGVSETDAIHKALADSARTYLPQYEPDDGPLTAKQHAEISSAVKKIHGRARVVDSLFSTEASTGVKIGSKTIRTTSRPR